MIRQSPIKKLDIRKYRDKVKVMVELVSPRLLPSKLIVHCLSISLSPERHVIDRAIFTTWVSYRSPKTYEVTLRRGDVLRIVVSTLFSPIYAREYLLSEITEDKKFLQEREAKIEEKLAMEIRQETGIKPERETIQPEEEKSEEKKEETVREEGREPEASVKNKKILAY